MTSKPRALTEAAPCYCCGARWLAVTTCVYPGPGPGPADVSSLRQLGDGRQGRGRARPEQAARAQQRPVGCDQGPGGHHCSYTQTPGADTVTSDQCEARHNITARRLTEAIGCVTPVVLSRESPRGDTE